MFHVEQHLSVKTFPVFTRKDSVLLDPFHSSLVRYHRSRWQCQMLLLWWRTEELGARRWPLAGTCQVVSTVTAGILFKDNFHYMGKMTMAEKIIHRSFNPRCLNTSQTPYVPYSLLFRLQFACIHLHRAYSAKTLSQCFNVYPHIHTYSMYCITVQSSDYKTHPLYSSDVSF